jgi:hypothetical protein
MRKSYEPSVKTETLNAELYADEDIMIPVKIDYEYYKTQDLFYSYGITVTGIAVTHAPTVTPEDIIMEFVKDEIREANYGVKVEFELPPSFIKPFKTLHNYYGN